MRIACKKVEPGARRPEDDEIKVENTKDWRLEGAIPREACGSNVSSQFVVTKHHAYCVIAVRGQALLIKLGGQTNGLHEHMYTDRFPEKACKPLLPSLPPIPCLPPLPPFSLLPSLSVPLTAPPHSLSLLPFLLSTLPSTHSPPSEPPSPPPFPSPLSRRLFSRYFALR